MARIAIISLISLACQTAMAASPNVDDATPYMREAYFAGLDGDYNLRERLLVAAQEADPDDAQPRWRAGEVFYDGEWMPVAAAQAAAAEDPRVRAYRELAQRSDDSPAAHLQLARMCRRAKLDDEARYHWQQVLDANPRHPEALRALRLRLVDGEYIPLGDLRDRRARQRADSKLHSEWQSKIRNWEHQFATGNSGIRDTTLEAISTVSDPQSIASFEEWTLPEWAGRDADSKNEDAALAFVMALSNMSDEAAVDSLVRHSLASSHASVRESAATALGERSWYAFVPDLLDTMEQPVESNWSVNWNNGDVRYMHTLFQRGAFVDREIENRQNLRQFDPDEGRRPWFDPVLTRIATEAETSSRRYAREAARVETQVAATNGLIDARNERIAQVLRTATGEPYDSDPDNWWDWWIQYTEVAVTTSRPVERQVSTSTRNEVYEARPTSDPNALVVRATGGRGGRSGECFVAGTLVWTKTGLEAIEDVGEGDLVLSQNTQTGELAFRAVVAHTVRQPSPAMNIDIEGETITATVGHPFWQLGEGWQMAKQLEPGGVLSGASRPWTIESLQPAGNHEAHNLIVAEFGTYFVGNSGLLVHDGTPTPAVREVAPGMRLSD